MTPVEPRPHHDPVLLVSGAGKHTNMMAVMGHLRRVIWYTIIAYRATGITDRVMSGSPLSPREDLYARIIQALVDARHEAKLRQVDVARLVGWPQSYVSRYENHERTLDVAEYVEVARAIGVDAVALLAGVLGPE